MQAFKNYIGGKFVSAKSRNTFETINPANKKVLAHFQDSDKRDVDEAVKSAKRAFRSWSEVPAPRRGDILFEAASILRKRKSELGKLVTQEMGKVLKEGLGDVQEAIDTFEYFAGEGRRSFGYTTPSELKDKMCFTVRRPFGVAGLITPWNFPIAVPSWKIAPALVCGNTLVFKPASDAPLCAYRLLEILVEAGIPKGVVNLVTGSGEKAGSPLAKNPDVRVLSFTGSKAVGEFIT
ncbi:MAG TPA: aldehyde dehydrogenase family protein, partial [Candidatus Nanoarchaeia archaeon]|nr:aldehyde dehydrogenase family protein [Candidatus Nanoarchaeia archaeon]